MSDYVSLLGRPLYGILKWEEWDRMWQALVTAKDGWYVYFVGQPMPTAPLRDKDLKHTLEEINKLLRREHDEEYLGIVYADDVDAPSVIKIYDPNNLGTACSSSGAKIPPGWILSKIQPDEAIHLAILPLSRKRWWEDLMTRFTKPFR